MGVFGIAASAALFREAALAAAYELDLFDVATRALTVDELAEAVGITSGKHRVRALVDALVETRALVRIGDGVTCGDLLMYGGEVAMTSRTPHQVANLMRAPRANSPQL